MGWCTEQLVGVSEAEAVGTRVGEDVGQVGLGRVALHICCKGECCSQYEGWVGHVSARWTVCGWAAPMCA